MRARAVVSARSFADVRHASLASAPASIAARRATRGDGGRLAAAAAIDLYWLTVCSSPFPGDSGRTEVVGVLGRVAADLLERQCRRARRPPAPP